MEMLNFLFALEFQKLDEFIYRASYLESLRQASLDIREHTCFLGILITLRAMKSEKRKRTIG